MEDRGALLCDAWSGSFRRSQGLHLRRLIDVGRNGIYIYIMISFQFVVVCSKYVYVVCRTKPWYFETNICCTVPRLFVFSWYAHPRVCFCRFFQHDSPHVHLLRKCFCFNLAPVVQASSADILGIYQSLSQWPDWKGLNHHFWPSRCFWKLASFEFFSDAVVSYSEYSSECGCQATTPIHIFTASGRSLQMPRRQTWISATDLNEIPHSVPQRLFLGHSS